MPYGLFSMKKHVSEGENPSNYEYLVSFYVQIE